jgi:YHS domain-containing protein
MKKLVLALSLLGGLGCTINGGATWDLKDPVCGVTCVGDKCEQETFRGKQFYFCSQECRKRFDRDPDQYLNGR